MACIYLEMRGFPKCHKDDILLNPDWMKDEEEVEDSNAILLLPLPDSLQSLNGITMKALIRGIMKDLKFSWDSEKPEWWPVDIPFHNMTQPAPDYEGMLCVHTYSTLYRA